jgi:hypothetical protein
MKTSNPSPPSNAPTPAGTSQRTGSIAGRFLPLILAVAGILGAAFFWNQAKLANRQKARATAQAAEAAQQLTNAQASSGALLDAITSLAAESDSPHVEWKALLDKVELAASNVSQPAAQANMFSQLAQAYKSQGRFRDATTLARRALDSASDTADEKERMQLQSELAFNQLLVGDIPEGMALCEELLDKTANLGDTDPLRLAVLNASANADFMRGEIDKGLVKARKALKGREDRIEEEDPNLLFALNSLVMVKAADGNTSAAVPIAERVTRLWESHNPNHIAALAARNTLATLYGQKADTQGKSINSLEKVLDQMVMERGADDPATLKLSLELVRGLVRSKDYARAIRIAADSVQRSTRTLGEDNPTTIGCMNGLALAYHFSGKHKEAAPLLAKVLEHTGSTEGKQSETYLQSIFDLAVIQFEAGQLDDAMRTAEEAIELYKQHQGPDHQRTRMMTVALAEIYGKNQLYGKSARLYNEHYDWRVSKNQLDPETIGFGNSAGSAYRLADEPEKAISILKDVRDKAQSIAGEDHPTTLLTTISLARANKDAGNLDAAAELAEASLARSKSSLGDQHGVSCDARACQFEVLMKQQSFANAEGIARELFGVVKETPETSNLQLALAANMIGEAQLRQGNNASAKQLLSAIVGSLNDQHATHTLTAATNILLGEAYLEEGNASQAEEYLLKGYGTLAQQEARLSIDDAQRLTRAKELLVRVFEAQGDAARADEFRSS